MSGAIIKSGMTDGPIRGMYAVDLRDIAAQADEALSRARAEADRLLEAAREQAVVEREAARAAGYRAGHETGLADGRKAGHDEASRAVREQFSADQAPVVSAMTEMVETFRTRREQLFLAARRDVVVLSIVIAQRLVSQLAGMDEAAPAMAMDACAEAIALLGKRTEVTARVHPEDLAAMHRLLDGDGDRIATDAARAIAAAEHIRLVADEDVDRGGAIVRAADCEVDATVNERVTRIADELVTGWRARRVELGL